MSFSSFIGKRLSLKTGARRRWAPAIVVAIGGIAMSLAVMLVSVGIVTGFRHEIIRKIMGFDAQITITPLSAIYTSGPVAVSCDETMRRIIADAIGASPGEESPEVTPALRQTGLLKTDDDFLGVLFKGYGDGYGWCFEKSNLLEGNVPSDDNPRGIVISSSMASKLSLGTGDKVNVYFFIDGTVRPRRFEVTGIYCSNFGEYDDLVAYTSHKALSGLLKYASDEGMSVEVRGLPETEILPAASRLQRALSAAYTEGTLAQSCSVSTVYASGAAYFNWLNMLDTNIVVILVLMGCVSGFMLVSCVLILILERVRLVGILKSLGATNRQTGMIFVHLGLRVTLLGLLLGNVVGLAFVGAQSYWHFMPLDPASYYLSYVPVELTLPAWLALNVGTAVFSLLLMFLPAAAVSRISPVKVMRFE